jgi:glycosyltransferase involved in cell wall biosynthesis
MKISMVINTFDQPDYLSRVLAAVARQTSPPEEVLLADDGSGEATRELFAGWSQGRKFRTGHLWQAHEGFRRAQILNQAIADARGDYLVFLDGDTVPHPAFIADHAGASRPGYFVQGHRALVERKAAAWFGQGGFVADRRWALLQNQISSVKNAFRWPWAYRKTRNDLRGIRGCNLAIWRGDLVRVNGYNEDFAGWGREDSELAARLLNSGTQRLDVRGRSLCYHLWHPPASRARLAVNDDLLEKAIGQKSTRCEHGLDRHLS